MRQQKPTNKRFNITRLVLEKMVEFGEIYWEAFFPPQYAYTHTVRELFGLAKYPKVSQRTLSSILSRLQNQGLVERTKQNKQSRWNITRKGINYLGKKRNATLELEPPKKDNITRLVIFDIPEKQRNKRDAIRTNLIACDFRQLQKSVWVGHNPLPKDFIELITELGLDKMIHIFDVKNKGTLS